MIQSLRNLVRSRAEYACEYCRLPQAFTPDRHHIDHILACQHGGLSESGNLALSCADCNACKGPNIAGFDPQSGIVVPLYHPRRDRWDEHFRYENATLVGRTLTGRVTIHVLQINDPERVAQRQVIMDEGRTFPGLE